MSAEEIKEPSTPVPKRTKYQGVLNVVRFNKLMYESAIPLCLLFTTIAIFDAKMIDKLSYLFAAALLFFYICSSLLAAHIAYDRSGLYDLDWLKKILDGAIFGDTTKTVNLLNIHTGFDESTIYLQDFCRRMGATQVKTTVVDLYDCYRTTEPSITIANKLYPAVYDPSVYVIKSGPEYWDIPDHSIDLAVLFLSAHELRKSKERDSLFAEIARVLKDDGRLVLLEHLRDGPNILAFGFGAWHFFPFKEWFRATRSAHLQILKEGTISPYIHVFCLKRSLDH